MTHSDLAGVIDYDGMQSAIEAQLREQGWGDVHAEAGKDRLVIEAVQLNEAIPGWAARALREAGLRDRFGMRDAIKGRCAS